jgi:hypothetical protein
VRKLRVGIIDIVSKSANPGLWGRVMNANFASIMPQVIATWCEAEGHEVSLVCYTGFEDLKSELPEKPDLVFVTAFTQAAHLSYALSNFFRAQGAITAIGGPHARCYPEDAQRHFDYVLGFTDKTLIRDLLADCSPQRPLGVCLAAKTQPTTIPGVRERWKFIEATMRKAPIIKIVPMMASMGCPYTCSFCIDADVPFEALDVEVIKEDLRFLMTKYKRPRVGWHDPNFGVRFDDIMQAIEEVVPDNQIDFVAESTLSLLSEDHVKRMAKVGFKALLPGIETWHDLGGKSKTGGSKGMEKVLKVSEQVNMILRHVPYLQANFVLGLDTDEGPEPFELTKTFLDMSPGAFPAFSLLTSFGQAAALNLEYQRDGRILPFPFHFLNNNHAMNVRVKNYEWVDFYERVVDLTIHACEPKMIWKRLKTNGASIPGLMNVIRDYFEQQSTKLPQFYTDRIRQDLGEFWEWLPEGGLDHDPCAYLNSSTNGSFGLNRAVPLAQKPVV